MTVTGVRVAIDEKKLPSRESVAKAAKRAGLGDSKELCAHGSMREIEGRVLALLEVHMGQSVSSLTALSKLGEVESSESLRRDCPAGIAPSICFDDPIALPTFGEGIRSEDREIALALKSEGFRLVAVAVVPVCTGRINLQREKGVSRMALDLDAMLAIVDKLHLPNGDASVYCGKVGGQSKYGNALSKRWPLHRIVEEIRPISRYHLPSVGEISFVMDGDASEPAISLASMVGKYVRELWMHRHNRYWVSAVAGTTAVSGYHDPVTEKLVKKTALFRKTNGILERCFERKVAAKGGAQ